MRRERRKSGVGMSVQVPGEGAAAKQLGYVFGLQLGHQGRELVVDRAEHLVAPLMPWPRAHLDVGERELAVERERDEQRQPLKRPAHPFIDQSLELRVHLRSLAPRLLRAIAPRAPQVTGAI